MPGEPAAQRARELEARADEAWWLCRVEESLAVRQQAYREYIAAGDGELSDLVAGWVYRQNHDRLARVKRRHDPGNLFRLNQNIPPG